jgi:hypothetical protein
MGSRPLCRRRFVALFTHLINLVVQCLGKRFVSKAEAFAFVLRRQVHCRLQLFAQGDELRVEFLRRRGSPRRCGLECCGDPRRIDLMQQIPFDVLGIPKPLVVAFPVA